MEELETWRAQGKERVSGEGKIELPHPSPELGSVVNLHRTNDNPLQSGGFNVKIKIIYVHLQSNGFWLNRVNSKKILLF